MDRALARAAGDGAGDRTAAPPEVRRPPAGWTWPKATGVERFLQGCLAAVLAGAVGLGLCLTPAPAGTGTHRLLGLPPCGMLLATGKPCPTCGVTTSFALAAHGRWSEALANQPFGLALFILVLAGLLLSVTTTAAGRSWYPLITRWSVPAFLMALVLLGLISWMYKWSMM